MIVMRKMTIVVAMLMPGGLFLLFAVAAVLLIVRRDIGRRALAAVAAHVPRRFAAVRRALLPREQLFLAPTPPLHS